MSEEKINHAPEDAAAAAEAELNAKLAKPSLMDIFVRGARKGWNIAIDNIIPNVDGLCMHQNLKRYRTADSGR